MEKLVKIDLGRKSKHSIAMAKIVEDPYEDDERMVVVKVTEMLEFKANPMFKPMFMDTELIIERRQIIG